MIYNGSKYVGDAIFVEGARPDVEEAYPTFPKNYRAGWGYMMLSYFLPNGGNGRYTIYAKATDFEGHVVTLGSKTITIDNNNAVKPFGAIDTPAQGGTASGSSYINWGWALTPQPNKIPENGSTIKVYVDGVKIGNPTYNLYRSDIASYFPDYANSDSAIGKFILDTTEYENGVHTIQWTATDNAGNTDGIGSRYFTIQNTGGDVREIANSTGYKNIQSIPVGVEDIPIDKYSPIEIIKGFNRSIEPRRLYPDDNGIIHVEIKELQRLEIHLANKNSKFKIQHSTLKNASYNLITGYLLVNDSLKSLPIGSKLDRERGIFYWQPGPGFIGNYLFVFTYNNRQLMQKVNIKITPKHSLK
jgi:hypothetical protein